MFILNKMNYLINKTIQHPNKQQLTALNYIKMKLNQCYKQQFV